MDGYIRIGTKLDTNEMDKDLQKLYNKLEKEQEKMQNLLTRKEQLDIDITKYQNKMEQAGKKTDELATQLDDIASRELEIVGLPNTIENLQKAKNYLSSLDVSKDSGKQIDFFNAKQFQEIESEFNKYVNQIDEANRKTALLEQKYTMVDNQIQKCESTQMKLTDDIQKASNSTQGMNVNLATMEKNANKVADKFGTMLKKIGKIALALVGVRTVINLIVRSFNTLAQYNEELGTKVEQMRLVLAVGLEPIINWLISMLHTILSLVNQISIALSGIDLFGRASELWTKKMAKNLSGSASSVKDMKKQLAGFDEMNVLSDTSASAGGGGGGGSTTQEWTLQPMFDWSKFDIHTLMDKALGLMDDIINGINTFLQNTDPKELADGVSTLIIGLLDLATKTFVDLDWEQLGKTLMETLLNLDWGGIFVALIENIVGSLTWPLDLLMGLIEGLVSFFESPDCLGKFVEAGIKIVTALVKGFIELNVKIIEITVKITIAVTKLVIDLILALWDLIKEYAPKIWEWLKNVFTKAWDWIKDLFGKMKEKFNVFVEKLKEIWNTIVIWIAKKIQSIVDGIKDRIETIKQTFTNIINWIKDKFDAVTSFFKEIGIKIGDFFSSAIKGAVNGALSWVESKVNWFIDKINSVISIINKIPGVSISKLSKISLPRLAVGGIINNPGKGVPVGSAIGGEAGREGILPLTDTRAMQELGREIGRWININATIPVNIGNRQVARIIQEINNDREFAMNGS